MTKQKMKRAAPDVASGIHQRGSFMIRPQFLIAVCVLLLSGTFSTLAQDNNAPKAIQPEAVNLGRPVDFAKDIAPILDANCVACHNLGQAESKLNLEEVDTILKGGKRGMAVVPKQPDQSLLYLVAARAKGPVMPPLPNKVDAKPLTPKELGLLRQWIIEGAVGGSSGMRDQIHWQPVPSTAKAIYSVAMAPWGRYVAVGRANQILVLDVESGDELGRLTDPNLAGVQFNGKPMYPEGAAHRDFVHSLAFSPDGLTIASGGFRTVKLWQRPASAKVREIAVGAAVTALALSPNGQVIATAGADNVIKLWNAADGAAGKVLSGHAAAIHSLAFNADGTKLASASEDKTIRLWNVADGTEANKIESPAPAKAVVFTADSAKVIVGQADNIIRIWPISAAAPFAPEKEIKGHGGPVLALALVPGGTQVLSGSEDQTARVWDLASGNQVRSLTHGGPVVAVAVRPDGQFVASASPNNIAKLWNNQNGQQVAELKGNVDLNRIVVARTEDQKVAQQHKAHAEAAFKAAETNLKERDESLKKANEAKAAADKAVTEQEPKVKEANDKLEAAKKAADEKKDDQNLAKAATDAAAEATKQMDELKKRQEAAASAMRAVQLAEQAQKSAVEQVAAAKAHQEAMTAAVMKADAELKAAQEAEAAGLKPVRGVAFAADGKRLFTTSDDGLVHVWDSTNGKPIENLAGHQGIVGAIATGPQGMVVTGSADQKVVIWDSIPRWTYAGQLGPKKETPLELAGSPFAARVLSLAFSPDGKWLATGGGEASRSGELFLWDMATQTMVKDIKDAHSDTIMSIEFSRDGKYLVTGAADKFVKLWDAATGKLVKSFEGHTHHVLGVTIKADNSLIASAGADNAIKVWNVETGEQSRTIPGYSKQVTSIHFTGVAETVVSCGGDKTVRFHNVTNGSQPRAFSGGTDFMYCAAVSRDEQIVVAGGEDGVLRVWNGQNGQAIRQFDPPKPADPNAQAAK
jgi:WD40 repeat protein